MGGNAQPGPRNPWGGPQQFSGGSYPATNGVGGEMRTIPAGAVPQSLQYQANAATQSGAPAPQDTGMGTGAGPSAYIPLPHGMPEFSAATYRLMRAIADERGQEGNSARYEDFANRAFENPLPGSPRADPGGVGVDAYGNNRWDYTRGPGQQTGSDYNYNTGIYNRGDGTHPGGLSRTPLAPLSVTQPFSPLTGEGYVQAPGAHPIVGPGSPGSQWRGRQPFSPLTGEGYVQGPGAGVTTVGPGGPGSQWRRV